jgi:hypothetical protein
VVESTPAKDNSAPNLPSAPCLGHAGSFEARQREQEARAVAALNHRPIGWVADSRHIFSRTISATDIRIDKLDRDKGQRESWQIFKPKNQEGLATATVEIAITPDGRRMVFTYETRLGQFVIPIPIFCFRGEPLHVWPARSFSLGSRQ